MMQLSKILRSAEDGVGGLRLTFFCPGCNDWHTVAIGSGPGARWDYNGDPEKPTFTPSVKVTYGPVPDAPEDLKEWRTERICHSFVRAGRIQFLNDCTHALAGQTVDLPDVDHDFSTTETTP